MGDLPVLSDSCAAAQGADPGYEPDGLTLVQATLVVVLTLTLSTIRVLGQVQDKKFAWVGPEIRTLLADQSFGASDSTRLAVMAAKYPVEFDKVFDDLISIVRGDARKKLGRAAEEAGLVQRWVRQSSSRSVERRTQAIAALGVVGSAEAIQILLRAFKDPAEVVRLEAGLALVRVGGHNETEAVFEFALTQNGLIRILVMESLRWRAHSLSKGILRRYLTSGDDALMLACLDTIAAWRVALDLPQITTTLSHPSALVRERGFRVLPYLATHEDLKPPILSGMSDPDERVRTAAAFAAGRLKIQDAVPVLENRLNASQGRLALTSAYSLAEMGSAGVDVLEKAVVSGHACSAAALEALERLRTGRFEHANL
jgi:HEAT repeat protein